MPQANAPVARMPLGIAVLCLAIVAMLWAALTFELDRSEKVAISQAASDARNLSIAFRENVRRTVSAIDQLMLTIIAENSASGDLYHMPAWVERSPLLSGMSVQVSMSDQDGIMAASNLGTSGRVDISDRPHFRYHLDPSAPQPYISAPVIGRNSGKWSIQITRRIARPDGGFGGIIAVSVDPFYFSSFFETVDLGSSGAVDLIGQDGVVRARRAHESQEIGQNVGKTELFARMQRSASGTAVVRSRIDGSERVFGYAAVPDYPLFVAVGLGMDDVLAPVRSEGTGYFVVGAILTIIIVTLAWFLARETRRRREQELAAHAEEKTREQKVLLEKALESARLLFELNPVPMFVVDCDGLRFLAVNDTAVRHYGYSREQFLAMTKLDLHPLEDRESYAEAFQAFRQSGDAEFDWKSVRRHRKADGADMLVHVYGRSLNYHGRPAMLCSIVDVTERVQAERERDRNRELLDRVIENVTMTILVKDARTLRYVLVNKAAEKLWGLPREAVIGKTAHEIFDRETADSIETNERKLLQSGSSLYDPEHKVKTPCNGVRLLTANRLVIRDQSEQVQYLLAVIEDVTDRKSVEDQLRQAQKMEAIGNLTGGVAHDFNNLLTVILGNLDLLQDELTGNPSAQAKITTVIQAAERGADLTGHMLAFSRRQPLQAKEVDVNALIGTTKRLLARTLGENITIEVRPAPGDPIALVDQSQLETALLNVAINARDAMPDGGTLTIGCRVVDLDQAHGASHGLAPGAYVVIEIADTGTGMPPELTERIFEPFFTTKPVGKGTGLGLSMVYGFLKQSGGDIRAYSELGHGTVFKLFLPLRRRPGAAAAPLPPRAARATGKEVILAVEDNPDIRVTVVRQLSDLGYQVREADCAEAALRILDTAEPVDLLFTDMIMPGGINGKELATRARVKHSDLKVLFTSGFPGTSGTHGAQLDPGDVLLSKPYHKHDLARAVEEVLTAPAA